MIKELAEAIQAIMAEPVALRAYIPSEVPNGPTYPYVVIYVMRRGVGGVEDRNRISDQTVTRGWRIETMAVGKDGDEALWMQDKVAARLEDRRLTIDTHETTPLHYEGGSVVDADPGVENLFWGASTWTCVSTALQPA